MKEALLYEKLNEKKVRCHLCAHHCFILPGKKGICQVRENKNGTLYSLVYEKAISLAIDPIEKKPFFHYLPGTHSLSVATMGCNFQCDNCQNWQISQGSKGQAEIAGYHLPVKKIIEEAQKNQCRSIAYTYTEPTIFFEYALETMKLAKTTGIKNLFVSNGFMSNACLEIARGFLDAINVDLKFFDDSKYRKYCGGRLEPILKNLRNLKKMGVWLEITTLSIPQISDSEEMFEKISKFIYDKLGSETPWHISRFSGGISYKLDHLEDTPISTLEKAYTIGEKNGLKYVYLGNVPGHDQENTYCPKCHQLGVKRTGYLIERHDNNGLCPSCQYDLDLNIP